MDPQSTYSRFAKYYDLYVQGFEADLPLYLSCCGPGDRILEVGCGTGRVLQALLDAGRCVTGVDVSGEMLAIAEAKLRHYVETGKLRLIKHDLVDSALEQQYERVFVTFYTLNYLLSPDAQRTFLINTLATMANGGTFAADLFCPQSAAVENAGGWCERRLSQGSREVRLLDRRRMKGRIERREQRFIEGDTCDEITTLRRFVTKEEMNAKLEREGFESIQFADGYGLSAFHALRSGEPTQSSFVAIARKRARP